MYFKKFVHQVCHWLKITMRFTFNRKCIQGKATGGEVKVLNYYILVIIINCERTLNWHFIMERKDERL
jgi:hypothetical protein